MSRRMFELIPLSTEQFLFRGNALQFSNDAGPYEEDGDVCPSRRRNKTDHKIVKPYNVGASQGTH